MNKFLNENWIILVIGVFLMASMTLAIRNNYVIEENHQLQQQTQLIRQRTQSILSLTMHGLDLGVRGFALTKDNAMLRPYEEAIQKTPGIFFQLDSLLQLQDYDSKALEAVKAEVNSYIRFSKEMVGTAQADNMPQFISMLQEDKGYDVWKKYAAFSDPLFAYEEELNKQAIANYRAAMRNNLILQISILLLAMPLLYLFIIKMRRERDGRASLLKKVEENDREFVFNSGVHHHTSASEVNDTSIRNVKKASSFITQMADGNYEVDWEDLNTENQLLNKTTLAGKLLQLRDKLKQVKQEDEKRNWVNEGLTAFSEIIRTHQQDKKALANHSVIYIANYLKAQQAGLFILEGEDNDAHLELAACYAFNRKKFLTKRINIGEGLIGQTYLEGEVVQLKVIPSGYTHITSGLGEATPRYLVIVPFKYETHIPAIIEVSSFNDLEEHHLQFLKKAGEYLASAIVNSQNTSRMKVLLENASYNEKQMRQREEELRQNMEELQATQEQLVRNKNTVSDLADVAL